ncbi:MAG TPA: hypothetical protein VHR45_03775 [Thermoanaerobaculia bacterium]|nr:hypothetical protein [Thermoanaerobaculia bacterium]
MRPNWRFFVATLVGIALVVRLSEASGVGGRGGFSRTRSLDAQSSSGGNLVRFSCEFDPIVLALTSVNNRYKILRIDIANTGQKPLVLSPDKDHLEAKVHGHNIPAILNLSSKDPALWNSLADFMRKALVYPKVVDAGERESVFVFLASPSADSEPTELSYTIDSLPDKPVVLKSHVTAAR